MSDKPETLWAGPLGFGTLREAIRAHTMSCSFLTHPIGWSFPELQKNLDQLKPGESGVQS